MGVLNYYPDMTVAGGYGLLGPTVDLSNIVAQYRLGRGNLAQNAADAAFNRSMQLAQLGQDPYSPIAYLEAMAQSGSPIPLLGRGLTQLKPMIPRPAPTPADQYVQDFLQHPAAEPSDVQRVREAYARDPQAAATFFAQKPEDLRRMFGAAGGGTMMMRDPGVLVNARTRRPVATVSENGGEMIDMMPDGMRVRPMPGVSRKLGRGRQDQIVNMALGRDGKYSMRDLQGHDDGGMMAGMMRGMAGGGNWIAQATRNKGALHRQLGVPEGEKIPAATLERASHAKGKLGRRARLAETLRGFPTGGTISAPPLGNMLGKPLSGSLAQRLYMRDPALAQAWAGKPMSAQLLQYLFYGGSDAVAPSPPPATNIAQAPAPLPASMATTAPTDRSTSPPAMPRQASPLPASMATRPTNRTTSLGRRPNKAGRLRMPGAASGLKFGSDWTQKWNELVSAANPAAHRAAAARETTTWANAGPFGSAERRQRQDLSAATNEERLLAMAQDPKRMLRPAAAATASTGYSAADQSGTAPAAATGDTSQSLLAKELGQGLATVEGVPMAAIDMLNQGRIPSLNDLGGAPVWARIPARLRAILTGLIQSSGQGGPADIADALDRGSAASYF